jgi:hypothetical protein
MCSTAFTCDSATQALINDKISKRLKSSGNTMYHQPLTLKALEKEGKESFY